MIFQLAWKPDVRCGRPDVGNRCRGGSPHLDRKDAAQSPLSSLPGIVGYRSARRVIPATVHNARRHPLTQVPVGSVLGRRSMLESIMYFGVGFLFAALIGLAIFLRVHGRAVRLTTRRLEAAIPPSFAEVQIDKDLPRAEFAMSTRRPETTVEQLNNGNASQLAELGRKGDAPGGLTIERNAQQAEIPALKSEVEALKGRLTATGREANAEGDVTTRAPAQQPTALVTVPVDSSRSPPLNDPRHEGDVVSPVLKQWRALEIAWPDGPGLDPDAKRNSSDQGIGSAREKCDFSAGLPLVDTSIQIFPLPCGDENHQYAT